MQSSISYLPTHSHSNLMFNDNLLLPRLSSSCRVSPKLDPSNNNNKYSNKYNSNTNYDDAKKSWTAPTSPIHPYKYNNKNNGYDHLVTPQSSPTFPESSLPLSLHLPELNGTNQHGIILPSLRHLQLLPDPRVQEYSYMYPDTSERTSMWKDTLLNWCKNENYHDYVSIRQQPLERTNKQRPESPIPSILNCKDPFYGLSNKSWEFQSPVTPPMSPKRGSSPLMKDQFINDNIDSMTPMPKKKHTGKFTPVISDKLVQCVKKKQKVMKPSTTTTKLSSGFINTHKKTNSFKALQIKQMLMDRDVLSINSKRNSRQGQLVLRLGDHNKNYIPTNNATSNNNSNSNTGSNTLLSSPILSPKRSRSMSPRRNSKSKIGKIGKINSTTTTTTARSRSRSRSPGRLIDLTDTTMTTPPQSQINNERKNSTSSLPRYHKFSLVGTTSPVLLPQTNDTKTHSLHSTQTSTTKNKSPRSYSAPTSTNTSPRREKGMNHTHHTHHHHPHGALRKCVSCDSQDSPCWRPSWSKRRQDQLCNSCGLRYKKTKTRCLNMECKKIPTKGELNIMKSQGKVSGPVANNPDVATPVVGYRCLFCNSITETQD